MVFPRRTSRVCPPQRTYRQGARSDKQDNCVRAKTDKEQACAAGIGFGHAQLEERKELRVLTSEPGRLVIWACLLYTSDAADE